MIKSGDKRNTVHVLGPQGAQIGRDPSNDIVLSDRRVSKHHCRITCSGADYLLEDLGSVNGTQVNGEFIKSKVLKLQDAISVGPVMMVLLAQEASDSYFEHASSASKVVFAEHDTAGVKERIPAKAASHSWEDFGQVAQTDLPKAYQRLLILYRLSNQINSVTNLDLLFERILDIILDVMNADRGFIMLANESSTDLIPRAAQARGGAQDSADIVISKSMALQVLHSGESVLTSDAQKDTRFLTSQSVIMQGIRSAMCVPLKCKDKVLGIMHIDTTGPTVKFTREDLEMLSAIASQAAMVIENALLFDKLVKARDQIEERQNQLIESEKLSALGRLAAGVAHEINNPMTCILGFSQLSSGLVAKELWDAHDKEECVKFLKVIESEAIRCQSLVQTLLQFGRKKKQQMAPTDINQVIEAALLIAKFHIKHTTIEIQKHLQADLPHVTADPSQLQQVFLNLIVNARDAMEEKGGILKISSRQVDEQWIEVAFADSGCGIPEDKLNEIFKPLYTTKPEGKGTGLGLSITQDIIEVHKGKIDVKSQLGVGTTFFIQLPNR